MLIGIYAAYVFISVAITVWVGHTLSKNGLVFLVQNFAGNRALAESINHLLLVGFYLINFGYVTLALKYGDKPQTLEQGIEFLSTKVGLAIVILGLMHFLNMYVLVRFRGFTFAAQPQKV
jgi:hypothetical protein